MVPLLCRSLWEMAQKRDNATARTMPLPGLWSFVQEEAVPWDLPWHQTLQFLSVCLWCPSSCCPGARAQREWVYVSFRSFTGPLRGDIWESCSLFFCCPILHYFFFFSWKLCGLIFLAREPWADWSSVGLGSLAPEVFLPIFINPILVWDHPFHISMSPESPQVSASPFLLSV